MSKTTEVEAKLVSTSAVEEAKRVIATLYKTGIPSSQYMASGGNVILTILGLQDEEDEEHTTEE